MTVLVSGGAGYIGSHMVLALRELGEEVLVVDNFSTGFVSALPKGVHYRGGDVGDLGFISSLIEEFRVTDILHLAAKISVPESVVNPILYYDTNTIKSLILIKAAVSHRIKRFIFSSTAAVYGNSYDTPLSEDALPAPVSPYGRSKLMTEWMLGDAAAANDFKFVALRYFNVAGADPSGRAGQSTPNATHLVRVAIQTALGQRSEFGIFGTDYPTPDGTCIRDYIHVTDLVTAHISSLDYLRKGGESLTLNCGYGRGFSVRDVVGMVQKVTGVNFRVTKLPRRVGDPASIVARSDRIRAELGWKPNHDSLEEIVATAFQWEQSLRR